MDTENKPALDIYGGLLGAGKTTLIRRMLQTAYLGQKVAIIENEFGSANLDSAELEDPSYTVTELTSGCICCTLKGSFTKAVGLLVRQQQPDVIIVEPSGIADIRDVAAACEDSGLIRLNRLITVIDGPKLLPLLKLVGDFFYKQIRHSCCLYVNFWDRISEEDRPKVLSALRQINPDAEILYPLMEEITADTFPDGSATRAFPADAERTGVRSLTARLQKRTQQDYTSILYRFDAPLTDVQLRRLQELLQSDPCIYRAKGYLPAADGRFIKMDYVFGDTRTDSRDHLRPDAAGQFVLIGKDLDEAALTLALSQL